MKAVILAGGMGTRISRRDRRQTQAHGRDRRQADPLAHHEDLLARTACNEFVICLGYKGYLIKEYFANYFLHTSDVTFDMRNNKMEVHQQHAEPWRVTLVDTGEQTQTGGRLQAACANTSRTRTFCFTYGDGVGDIDITALLEFHREHGKLATLTAVQPPGRFGSAGADGDQRDAICREAARRRGAGSTAGFSCSRPAVIDYIEGRQPSGNRAAAAAGARGAAHGVSARAASGSRWTRCATRISSKSFGAAGRPLGRCGHEPMVSRIFRHGSGNRLF